MSSESSDSDACLLEHGEDFEFLEAAGFIFLGHDLCLFFLFFSFFFPSVWGRTEGLKRVFQWSIGMWACDFSASFPRFYYKTI